MGPKKEKNEKKSWSLDLEVSEISNIMVFATFRQIETSLKNLQEHEHKNSNSKVLDECEQTLAGFFLFHSILNFFEIINNKPAYFWSNKGNRTADFCVNTFPFGMDNPSVILHAAAYATNFQQQQNQQHQLAINPTTQRFKIMKPKEKCKNTHLSHLKHYKVVWMIVLWFFVLMFLPATLVPIIHYFISSFNLSPVEIALEFLFLAVGTILFCVGLYQVFWNSCK